ncbi:MAG: DUF1571 domain-containing protein [Deltaproteobacteria bacterium]|nr:DUF1571 domain-containing protein [Deltaproteobacteria bacterium]
MRPISLAALWLAVAATGESPPDASVVRDLGDAHVEASAEPSDAVPSPDQVARAVIAETSRIARASEVEQVGAAIQRMQRAAGALKDFTATFYKKEYKGKQLPEEKILLKYRAEPRSLYLGWTGDVANGQEVLWQRGWNGERARAHPGSFPDFTLNLPTSHYLATRNTRHEIPMAGFDFTISMFARDLVTGRAKPECVQRAADTGPTLLFEVPSRCFELETDKAKCPEMYAFKARLCIHERLGLPNKIQVWDREDGELRLVEDYGYDAIQVNVGLTDKDFDPDNEAYDF